LIANLSSLDSLLIAILYAAFPDSSLFLRSPSSQLLPYQVFRIVCKIRSRSHLSPFAQPSLDVHFLIYARPAPFSSPQTFLARAKNSSGHAVWPAVHSGEQPSARGKNLRLK
jgi:hypothetical protein